MQQLTWAMVPSYDKNTGVRIGWATSGQPDCLITDDVAFLRCITVDFPINRTRDIANVTNPADTNDPPQTMGQLTTYQRVWRTYWELSGPNSFDRARQLHSGLFGQVPHDTFAALGLSLYWVTDVAAPVRIPIFRDGQWWERVDFEADFNELVTEFTVIGIGQSVEVQVITKDGVLEDFTVDLETVPA